MGHAACHFASRRRAVLFDPLARDPLSAVRARHCGVTGALRHPGCRRRNLAQTGFGCSALQHHGAGQYRRRGARHCRRWPGGGVLDVGLGDCRHRNEVFYLLTGRHVPGQRFAGQSAGRSDVCDSRGIAQTLLSAGRVVRFGRFDRHLAHVPSQSADCAHSGRCV